MSTLNQDRLLITLCIAFAFEMCWVSEREFHAQVEEMGEVGMRHALQLALDSASRQTAMFATPSPEVIAAVKRAFAAERN